MAITNEVDLTHIARTTEQWENTYDRNVIIPEGVLCIEFTPSGKTNIKIGDGHHIFSRLPYVNGSSEIIDCYTKQETDNRIVQILNNECVVRIKGILDDASKLPVHAACGDLWFVIRQNPEQGNKFEEYLYSSEHHWELIGGTPVDIDLSKYATKEYVDGKIRDIENKLHTHDNKSILDQITAAFTKEEKEKLKNLYNYDDTELRELIAKSLHTHSNKEVLDAITKYDIDKLRTLENYDDTLLKKKITALEALAHEHSNKSILDKTTASFTTDYERLMSLIRLYIGATGFDDGAAGLVPPAKAGEQNYVLTGSGKWVPNTGGSGETYELPIASATELGGIKIGEGLEISEDGTLTVVGGGGGSGSGGGAEYHEGDGIQFKQETGKALYRVLDYIEATGTQRIDTDIMLSGTSHVVDITYQLTDITVDNYVYTVGGIFDAGGQVYGILTTSTKELCSGICQSGTAYEYVSIAPPTEKTTDSYFVNATSFGSTLTGSKNHNTTVLNETISFFGFIRNEYNSYLGKVKLYSCDVKCDDVIIASFIPVMRISDSVYGLYDTISKKFFTNTYNETPFVAGTQTGEVIYGDITTINVKPATNTEIGGIIVGDGLSITEDGILSTTSEAGIQYEAGRAIEIADKIIPGDLVLDIFQDGTNWVNGAYQSSSGNVFINGWSASVHSPVNSVDVMYKVPDSTNRYRIEKRSVNGTQLSCGVSYINDTGYHFASSPVWEDDDITIHECPAGTAFIAVGIRWLDHVSSISVSDIGVVNLVWVGAGESVENVKVINAQIATTETSGVVTVGNGLTVTEEGVLSVSDDINNSYHAGLGINITEEPIPGDIELNILNNEYAGWENFTYLWTGGAEYEETNYVLHTTRNRIADKNTGEWLTHFKLPDGVERIKVEAAAKDGTPLKFWIDNHDSETLYRWSLLGRWYDSGETTDYPDEYKPALLKYNYISIGLCFDTNNTRTISVDDIDYVRLYFIEADKENPKGTGKYINSNIATDYQLGGVIIGKGINVDKEGVISVDEFQLEPATADKLGGVKIGEGLTITEDGTISATASTVYNAGKGISITKRSRKIPVEYQEIEYIESAGDAIFDTGYLANPSTVIDMDCIVYESSKADWQFLYGSRSSTYDTTTVFGFVVRNYHKGYVPELWISGEQLGTSSTFPYNERTILKQNMNELTWYPVSTEVPVTITGTNNLPTSSTTLAVSGFKDGSTYTFGPKCRIYSLKISDVNGITRDYVPCYRISDGVVGLYDLINDTFRYSATSTAFISGPVVSDSGGSTDYELYINNTGLLDANLKEDAPGVIIVSKSDETKELDVFQYISGLEVYCVEDSI